MYITGAMKALFSLTTVTLTFYSMGKFVLFLSNPDRSIDMLKSELAFRGNDSYRVTIRSLLLDMILLSLFGLAHSFLAGVRLKSLLAQLNLQVLARSIYVLTSSVCLLLFVRYWKLVPHTVLWQINATEGVIWWSFTLFHAFLWLIIYGGSIQMDIGELLGVKAVYNDVQKLPPAEVYMSYELKKIHRDMRHPSVIAFALIFWVCPVMSLDRLLLAAILTLYMALAWKPDWNDYKYFEEQFERKQIY